MPLASVPHGRRWACTRRSSSCTTASRCMVPRGSTMSRTRMPFRHRCRPSSNTVATSYATRPPRRSRARCGSGTGCPPRDHWSSPRWGAAADAIVSMGGYNSVCEALSVSRPLVIVPRATHKVEQQIRAETLAAHGLARWVHPTDAGPETLAAALGWALDQDRETHARLVRAVIPAFDGAARLTAYLARWLGD